MPKIKEYLDYYNDDLGEGKSLKDLFSEETNGHNAYKTYYHILITVHNKLNPNKAKDTTKEPESYKRACDDLKLEIENIREAIKKFGGNAVWKKLTNSEKDELVAEYKNTSYGHVRMAMKTEIEEYNKKNDHEFKFDDIRKKFEKKGKELSLLNNYIKDKKIDSYIIKKSYFYVKFNLRSLKRCFLLIYQFFK